MYVLILTNSEKQLEDKYLNVIRTRASLYGACAVGIVSNLPMASQIKVDVTLKDQNA